MVTHGSSLTIYGSGFGSKSTAAPLIWDNFESGTGTIDSGDPATVGTWDAEAVEYRASYSSDYAHAGSRCAKTENLASVGHSQRLRKDFVSDIVYLDYWCRVHYLDNKSRNWKTWILYSDNGDLQCNWVYFCNGSALTRYDGTGSLNTNSWSELDYNNDTWMHFSLAFRASTPNVADGAIYHYINEQIAGLASSSVITRNTDHGYDLLTIGELWQFDAVGECQANSGAYVYIDDVYIDTTWARVVVGDAPTWENCTHKEMQIPHTTWNATTIQVTVNRGTFGATDTAYLYVVDSAGAVNSSGYEITFGEEEDEEDTTAPYTGSWNPAKSATGIAKDTNIVVHVLDDGDGVDQSTIVMTVEGSVVTPTITGTSADYTLTYNPAVDFSYGQVVNVTVDASDLASNAMTQDSYSFTIESAPSLVTRKIGGNPPR